MNPSGAFSDYAKEWLEASGARSAGGSEYTMKCPFCCASSGHLYVNPDVGADSNGELKPPGRWCCFRCGEKSFNIANLIAEVDGISIQDAKRMVAKWRLGNIQFKRIQVAPKPIEQVQALPLEFEALWDGKRWLWPKYLTSRDLDRETAVRMGLGVCRSGEYAHRVILPIECPAGSSFTGRAMHEDAKLRYKAGPGAGRLLYGWKTIVGKSHGLIVEGPFDELRAVQAEIPCVALMGLRIRESQLAMLSSVPVKWTVMLDGSPEALASAAKIARTINGTRVAYCPAGRKDPGASQLDELKRSYDLSVCASEARMVAALMTSAERHSKPVGTWGAAPARRFAF